MRVIETARTHYLQINLMNIYMRALTAITFYGLRIYLENRDEVVQFHQIMRPVFINLI